MRGGQKSLLFVRRSKWPRTSSLIAVDTCESEDALDKYNAAALNSSEGGIVQSVVEDGGMQRINLCKPSMLSKA
jgi:hypothetical protein